MMLRLAHYRATFVVLAAFSIAVLGLIFGLILEPVLGSANATSHEAAPSIQSLLKPKIYQRITQDREISTYANLKSIEPSASSKEYSFYAAMQTRAGISRTRQVLTDYQLYSKLIPYVDEASYQSATHLLILKGGIWKWKLYSILRFEEKSERWIHFQIVGGHFIGMKGDIFFEPVSGTQNSTGTLVYMRGSQQGTQWPPAFILEQGAQIVFEFTAKRMRSYLESVQVDTPGNSRSGRSQNDEIPKPRSHL
jgi:hypothetical protein